MDASNRIPVGIRPNALTFWLFAQRVAWGEATPSEIAFMNKMFDLIEKMDDWTSGTNDYMAGGYVEEITS